MKLPQFLGNQRGQQGQLDALHRANVAKGRATRAAILRVVRRRPGLTTGAIAHQVRLGACSVREHLRGLERDALVRRERGRNYPARRTT